VVVEVLVEGLAADVAVVYVVGVAVTMASVGVAGVAEERVVAPNTVGKMEAAGLGGGCYYYCWTRWWLLLLLLGCGGRG